MQTADPSGVYPSPAAGAQVAPPELGALQALLNHVPGRVFVVARDFRFLYVNREFLEFTGVEFDRAIGHHMAALLGLAAFERYLTVAKQLFDGESQRLEGWVEYEKQGRRYVQEHLMPFAPAGGGVVAMIAFGRELTELKQRELELAAKLQELQTSEALKSAIVDHALVALISTDDYGRIVEFNPSAEAMFSCARADVVGRRVSEVVIPERFRAAHEAGMLRMHAGGAPKILGKRMQMHAMRADASEFPVEMVLWRTDVAHAAFYTASIVDVTERQTAASEIERQREALRQSEKLSTMGSLLAGVAHEMNNPLAIVMGRASLLEEKCEAFPELKADARLIREAADRCGRIVRTFLDMARSKPSQRHPVAINEMVSAATEMLRYGFRSHGIDLEMKLADALPLVSADVDQIGQVVMNLLINSQQALAGVDGARRVRVATVFESLVDAGEPRVALYVADNGPGVPQPARARVFEPFFTTKPEGFGTGLGLAVSRSIARAHGGDLTLEVASAQSGATFCLSLPICGTASEDTSCLPAMHAGSVTSLQARVHVVDDETDLASMMRDMLEGAGYEVATAESGAVALELLVTARFDAIVSDLRMPDMDGSALWREVSSRHPPLARRILFVTGDTLSSDARTFLRSTGCASLDKPFTKPDLLAKVADLLR
ncbi:MAG: PAS domain S-box protein [Proteobacteria bacterium]|nr:PAS domain S-box protein [Burkholderiales bacterium]